MNIANPTSKPNLGGNCISNATEYYLGATLAYLEIRISDTFGWPLGISYKLNHRPSVLIKYSIVHLCACA